MTLRVLVVDDHPAFRRALTSALNLVDNIEVAGEAGGGLDATEKVSVIEPDLVDAMNEALLRLEHELSIRPGANLFEGDHTIRIYNLLAHDRVHAGHRAEISDLLQGH